MDILSGYLEAVHLNEQYTVKLEPCCTTDPTLDQTVQVSSPASKDGEIFFYFQAKTEDGTSLFETVHSRCCNKGGLQSTLYFLVLTKTRHTTASTHLSLCSNKVRTGQFKARSV